MSSGNSGPEAVKRARDEANAATGGTVRRATGPDEPRAGRAAAGAHVSEGGEDTYKGTVRGGGATPRNVPMFGVGVAIVILILLVLAYFVFR